MTSASVGMPVGESLALTLTAIRRLLVDNLLDKKDCSEQNICTTTGCPHVLEVDTRIGFCETYPFPVIYTMRRLLGVILLFRSVSVANQFLSMN